MIPELALPYSHIDISLDELPIIPGSEVATVVALNYDGIFISINYHELKPGDVVLFREAEIRSGWQVWSRIDPIVAYQMLLLPKYAAQWTHVGILDDNLHIWDAMPSHNVRSRPLRDVLKEKSNIAIVRPQAEIDLTLLRTTLLLFSNHPYSIFKIETGHRLAARLLNRRSSAGLLNQRRRRLANSLDEATVFCSSFVSGVLRRVTQIPFFQFLPIVTPGDFACDNMFKPVVVRWGKVSV